MQRRKSRVALAFTGAVLLAAALIPASAYASAGDSSSRSDWTPGYDKADVEKSFQGSRTVPHWTSSFTDPTNHVAYPFTIVGSDPRLGGSTTVATVIVPLTFKFVAGSQDVSMLAAHGFVAAAQDMSMSGADDVAATLASPIFTPSNFSAISGDSGVQYGDAVMRAQFGQVGTGYHVILGQPDILKPVTIDVPEDKGVAVFNPIGVLTGIVDATWFKERLRHAISERHVDPTTLPIFLSHNVFQYQGNYLNCCSIGGHGAGSPTSTDPVSVDGKGRNPVHTYVYAAYITPHSFPGSPLPIAGQSDIHALSHEISEWMTNPFGGNMVQPYQVPLAPPGTCGSALESGDVVAGVWFPMPGNPDPASRGMWHPQDEAFLNWFARNGEAADLAPADGRFTFMGPLTSGIGGPYGAFGLPAQAC